MGCLGSAPKAPDPTQTAAAQTKSNIDTANSTAELNRINQSNPYGTSTYSITGTNPDGTPIYTQSTQLSAPQQQIFDAQQQQDLGLTNTANQMLGQVQNSYSQPMDTSSAGNVNFGMSPQQLQQYQSALNSGMSPDQISQYANSLNSSAGPASQTQAAQATAATAGYGNIQNQLSVTGGQLSNDLDQTRDAYYNEQKAMLDPQWAQTQNDLQTQLANQGLVQGSDAYNKAMTLMNQNKSNAYNLAQNNAILQGGQEQSRLQQMDLNAGNFANSAQAQGFNQSLANANLQQQANLANQSSTNQANLANQSANNQMAQYNAALGNSAAAQGLAGYQSNAQLNNSALGQGANTTLANAQQNNAANAQQLQQLFSLRNQPMNEFNALRNASPIQNPTFSAVPQVNVAGTDVAGITNQAYQGQLGAYNNTLSGIGGLAGATLGAAGNAGGFGKLFSLAGAAV